MYNGKSVVDLIKERTSVRNYEEKELSQETKKLIIYFMDKVEGPFSSKIRFKLIDRVDFQNDNVKLGTYGVIKGAKSFLIAALEKEDKLALVNLGFQLENIILYATSLDIGTCWLGGTFKRSDFEKVIELKDNEVLPVITPIGYKKSGSSLVDSIIRFGAGSNKRKALSSIVYNENFSTSLVLEDKDKWFQPLEMLRLAPSASNKQPWRIIKEGNNFHFYISHTPGYGNSLGFEIQRVDIGIAMCHFELTLKELGILGRWETLEQNSIVPPENNEYIVSWLS